ncbi:hypothetical protein FA15DRAFT_555589, partial [Coprinopsis marcescibilis]
SNKYSPPGASQWDMFNESCTLNGLILAGVTYGILFTIASQSVFLFFERPKQSRSNWIIYYTFAMLVLATIGFGGNTRFIEMTFVDYRSFPGGPNAFTVAFYSYWVNMLAFGCYMVMSWLADGLVLYRFILIYDFRMIMLPIPALMYMGVIATSICLAVSMTRPGADFWSQSAVTFAIAYWSLSLALNVSLTMLISGRLFFMRRRMKKLMGSQHSTPYLSLLNMLIESAALYSVWVIVFIGLYASNSPVQHVVFPPLGQIQGIAPLLIIFRVSQGKAWTRSS